MLPTSNRTVAYFSMEIALNAAMPTYSGGLGILAGDTLRSAADLGVPMIGVTLIHHKGYFRQRLDAEGRQIEAAESWDPAQFLTDTGVVAQCPLHDRVVSLKIWRYDVTGIEGHMVPVYLLDSNVGQNNDYDRTVTDSLYGGDQRYRLNQEAILGLGGLAAVWALGHRTVDLFHMNEGHSSLLTLGLLEAHLNGRTGVTVEDVVAVRKRCVFTTHTPVPAGHDHFTAELATEVLGPERFRMLAEANALHQGELNMTYLALRFSHYVNGVAMMHGEVSRHMFPEYSVRAITNGVHARTWTSPAFQELFDRQIPEWRTDSLYLRYAIGIPQGEIGVAHGKAKKNLLAEVARRHGNVLDEKVLTLGFARRATRYKRAELLFTDLDRLRWISKNVGRLQILYAGKAHPADADGKMVIQHVFQAAAALGSDVPVIYLENYDMDLAQYLTSGVDVWMNTPLRPLEASGTSGMKAALNGVPSLSILDGWWIEGCIEGVTGWAIGSADLPLDDASDETASLYGKLERIVTPMFYNRPSSFNEIRRSAIALNGSFFNTQRMLDQYVGNAYAPDRDQKVETTARP